MNDDNPWGRVRSETLSFLRALEYTRQFVGPIAQFIVVIDANVVLSDLRWLVRNRRDPSASTSVMECIKAGTFIAYISRSAFNEVMKHIPRIASENDLPLETMQAEWKQYRKLLKVRTPKQTIVERYRGGQDPDDAPHLALADHVRADGILSNDSDLVAMGGRVFAMEFALNARDYSRKMAVTVSIKALGITSVIVAVSAIKIAGDLFGEAIRSFSKLPPALRLLIVIAIVLIASNKSIRNTAKNGFSCIRETLATYAPDALEFISKAAETYRNNITGPPQLKYRS